MFGGGTSSVVGTMVSTVAGVGCKVDMTVGIVAGAGGTCRCCMYVGCTLWAVGAMHHIVIVVLINIIGQNLEWIVVPCNMLV